MKKIIPVIVEKTKTGFSAYAIDYPVITTGKTIILLQKNILEALNLYFEEEGHAVLKTNISLQMEFQ